jgi:hypothetical protein
MEGVEVGENGERSEEQGTVERSAEAASELGLEAGSGAGGQMRLGGPLQGRETGTKRPGEELRPGDLRTAGKGVDAARKLGQGAGHAPGGWGGGRPGRDRRTNCWKTLKQAY